MKSNNKRLLFFVLFILFTQQVFCQITNDSQLIKANHWVYEAIYTLSFESREVLFLDNPPLSVGELKFHLSQLDYEKLSDSGKILYNDVYNFLYTSKYLRKEKILNVINNVFPIQNFENSNLEDEELFTRVSVDLEITPELYARTNQEIASTVTYYYKGWPFNLPVVMGIANNFALEFDFTFGKNYESSRFTDSVTNIPVNYDQLEFEYPRYAYGNTGVYFDKWGLSATVGKEGFSIGKTNLGSVIYNSTFETDAYSVLNAYSPNFKYNLVFSQVEKEKFLYLHNFNFKLFSNLKFSLTEGGLRNGPIELRYLNPAILSNKKS